MTITQKLMKLKIKLLIVIMINILLLHNFFKFTKEIVDLRLKRANLASKSDIANFVKRLILIIN